MRTSRVLLYAIFLAPISLSIGGDNVSANYLFVILLLAPRGVILNRDALAYVVFMITSLLLGILVYSGFDGYFVLRQVISFILALMAVLLLFVRLDVRLEEFLAAAVLAASLYSLYAIWSLVSQGFSLVDMYFIKVALRDFISDWPQRYVALLVFSLFVALSRVSRGVLWSFSVVVILSCIFLTFTRSAWLAVMFGGVVYIFVGRSRRHYIVSQGSAFYSLLGLCISLWLLYYVSSNNQVVDAFSLLIDRLLELLEAGGGNFVAGGSEDVRLSVWAAIVDVLKTNPLTGVGFAGTHLVVDGAGSAHSQYADILLRTGIIGLVFYLWFWSKLFAYFRHVDKGVTAGLVALFMFGIFHETTKLSYGAVLFFVLLNLVYAQDWERRRREQHHKELAAGP